MTDEEKIQAFDNLLEVFKNHVVVAEVFDMPEFVGVLTKKQGLKGFHPCEIGHPVFEYKDRYIMYMHSETMLVEKVYNPATKATETVKNFYSVCVPYYKETLQEFINFKIGFPRFSPDPFQDGFNKAAVH